MNVALRCGKCFSSLFSGNMECVLCEARQQITAYQIAKDNLELRLEAEHCDLYTETIMEFTTNGPAQVY